MRQTSATHVRRLLPDLAGVGPQYTRLAGGLRALILDGRIPLGTRLPAERELARALDVSRTTTSAAYGLLRREGYLTSRRGAGSFAAFPAEPVTAGLPWLGEADEGVIDLSVAAPSALPESILEAVRGAVEQLPRHLAGDGYRVLGLPELREAVAERYRLRGLETTSDQVMITSGAQGAIALAAQVFVTPGAAVLVESPTYPNALDSFRAASARLVPVPVEDGWDDELVESSFRQSQPRLAYFTPDFHNPTGRLTLSDERATLVRAARRTETLLIADESYLGLALTDDLPAVEPLAAHDPERVISIGGLSKSAWGGLRIGWIRAAPSLVQRLGAARPSMDIANPLLEQLIALRLLDDLDELLAERRRRLRTRLHALVGALADELPDWTFTAPDGGLCLWAALDRSSTSLIGPAARAGVRIVPGPRFGLDGTLERFLRIPFVLPPVTLREAVTRLAQAAEDVPRFADLSGEVSYVV
ncbi:MAG TPA: PLP-dependent aminotransferase family protein [Gaiellaceae bacterium]|nr:PLP-dependent aminotransferase family protein [Gaiellaceae bacterium]